MEKEQLINAVYNKRAIWNQSHPDHRNRYVLDKLWPEVAEECELTVKAAQAKWKNLRDYFRNELKKIPKPKTGDPAEDIATKSHWPFFKNLLFLKDQLLPRQSTSNLSEDVTNETDNSVLEEQAPASRPQSNLSSEKYQTQTEAVVQSLPPTPSSSAMEEPRTNLASRSRKRTYPIDALVSIEREKLKLLNDKRAEKKTEKTPADEDRLFFESLIPHVKKIVDCDKLQFRNEVQTLVQKYAYKPPHSTFQFVNSDDNSDITLFSNY